MAHRQGQQLDDEQGASVSLVLLRQYLADNALPRVDTVNKTQTGRILGAWDKNGKLRDRAVEIFPSGRFPFNLPDWTQGSVGSSAPQPWQQVSKSQNLRADGGNTYIVGVLSWGPDGKQNTLDDINTMPLVFE